MRIKSYDGTIKNVKIVKHVVEKRFSFNGRTVRMAEAACSGKEDASGLYFEFGERQSDWLEPGEPAFLVGNLLPRVVKDALNTLLTKDYLDISQWDYQPGSDAFLAHEGTVFDEGKTKPYLSLGILSGLMSPFARVSFPGTDCMNLPIAEDNGEELEEMRKEILMRKDCKYSTIQLAEMPEEDLREIYDSLIEEE